MRRYTNIFFSEHNRLSGRVLLVMVTSSLLLAACSQSNTSASDSQPVQPEPTVATQSAQVVQPQAEPTAVTAPLINQTELLKSVSATVYKDANCGCCKEWVGYAEDNGLNATAQDVADLSVFKERYSVPPQMQSCHTTVTTDGYVFEGHVPAKHIAQFLENPPSNAIGLAVPGMPVGSPGMEYQDQFMPYQIMQINKDGTTSVYADIESPQQQL